MPRKFVARQPFLWSGGPVGAGDEFPEDHPVLGGDRAQFFDVKDEPEPTPAPKPAPPRPADAPRRGRPPKQR